jgi:hypothetical protein
LLLPLEDVVVEDDETLEIMAIFQLIGPSAAS